MNSYYDKLVQKKNKSIASGSLGEPKKILWFGLGHGILDSKTINSVFNVYEKIMKLLLS